MLLALEVAVLFMTYPPVWDQSELGLLELVGAIFTWFADQNQPFTILHKAHVKGTGSPDEYCFEGALN
jgi:hypothetical protein